MPPALRSQYERQLRALGPEPPRMTWIKAAVPLGVLVLFDFVRIFFVFFWIFGPALSGALVGGVLADYIGNFLAAVVAGATAVATGLAGFPIFWTIGQSMAEALGFAGLFFFFILFLLHAKRVFAADQKFIVKFVGDAIVTEAPILDIAPSLTTLGVIMYRSMIRHERQVHRAWVGRRDQLVGEMRTREAAYVRAHINARTISRSGAANDNAPPSEEAANDNEIPAHTALVA